MLKTEDTKTAYLKAGDSKYAFICWEPQVSKSLKSATNMNLEDKNLDDSVVVVDMICSIVADFCVLDRLVNGITHIV